MLTIDLFAWWALSISWSIAFLIVAGFYLYASSRAKRKENTREETKRKTIDENSIEFIACITLTVMSIVGYLVQTFWWLFPGCIFFLLSMTAVIERQRQYAHITQLKTRARSIAKDFIFVWILLGLLVFYIFSVQLGTGTRAEVVFALGNIVVEALLVFYLLRNRDKTPARNRTKSE